MSEVVCQGNSTALLRDAASYPAILKQAVEKAVQNNELTIEEDQLSLWKKWSIRHADGLDPIISGNPLVDLAEPGTIQQDLDGE
jgi:hypothetical protein